MRIAAIALLAGVFAARSAAPPPTVASICGAPPAGLRVTTSWLHTADGARLWAATAGRGNRVVVLAHESGYVGLCGWLPTMQLLASHGIRSVAFNFRGTPPSPLPRAAIETHWWRDVQAAIGAAKSTRVVVMGASFGGAEVVADGWRYRGIRGIASLSGELSLPASRIDAIGNAPKLRVPLLVVASKVDGYLDEADARRLVRRAGSKDKRLALFPGRTHGWDILNTEPAARRLVLGWLERHLG